MSLSVEELRELARIATSSHGAPAGPTPEEVARLTSVRPTEVATYLDSEDRNLRVAALRALSFADGPVAAEAILRGLDDPVKRVREVAAKCSPRFVSDPRVVARLQKAVTQAETGSAQAALAVLAGTYSSPYGLSQLEPVAEALRHLARLPRYRQQVLASLLRAPTLTEETSALLREFVVNGSKAEAVAATRRLCGFRVVRKELLSEGELRSAERAFGEVWYWAPPAVGA